MLNNEIFQELIQEEIQHISELFNTKNEQYKTNSDPLANFTVGAALRYGKTDMSAKYEVLKDYVGKHIAHVYNNDLDGPKVSESLQDIVVYFIIARVMAKLEVQE